MVSVLGDNLLRERSVVEHHGLPFYAGYYHWNEFSQGGKVAYVPYLIVRSGFEQQGWCSVEVFWCALSCLGSALFTVGCLPWGLGF